jgi:hypothetical protein
MTFSSVPKPFFTLRNVRASSVESTASDDCEEFFAARTETYITDCAYFCHSTIAPDDVFGPGTKIVRL